MDIEWWIEPTKNNQENSKMNINEYLEETRKELKDIDMLKIRQAIVCKDGFSVSVQASLHHYCRPRINHGPYSHVELGFPSKKVDEWMKYAETETDPTGTVYGWVPVEVVEDTLEQHGGIDIQLSNG